MTPRRITRLRSAETPTDGRRRWRRSIVGAVSALALAAAIAPVGAAAWPSDIDDLGNTTPSHPDFPDVEVTMPVVTADAAIVVARGSGVVLGTKNPDLRWAPASTTKIMTGLLAAEAIDSGAVSLDDIVTISSDVNVEGGGSAGLVGGDTISLRAWTQPEPAFRPLTGGAEMTVLAVVGVSRARGSRRGARSPR